MGLETGGSQKTYLSISDGKIAQRVIEGTDGAIKKTNKDGTKIFFEKHYPAISGYLRGAAKRTTDWGDKLQLDIEDGGVMYALEMPWSSRYSSGFFTCIPNIDVSKKIRFSPYMKVVNEGGKETKKTMLYLSYADSKGADGKSENIPWAFTKDAPNGLPEMVQIKVKGQMVWDDSSRQEFFENLMNNDLIPRIHAAQSGVKITTEKPAPINNPETSDIEDDSGDLPF
jgi:hypothetical protein